jgi:hypothetical protein
MHLEWMPLPSASRAQFSEVVDIIVNWEFWKKRKALFDL